MVDKLTKDSIKEIRDDITIALNNIGKKYGLKIRYSDLRYSEVSMTLKLQAIVDTEQARNKINTLDKEDFESKAPTINISKDLYGRKFIVEGKWYSVVSISTDVTNPIVVMDDDGNYYRMSKEELEKVID